MLYRRITPFRASGVLVLFFAAFFAVESRATSNLLVRVMAANTTSGNGQSYEAPGIRIFQGLKPDIVAIQEFRYNSSSTSNSLRQLVNTAFGTNFYFYCEPSGNIPNGIVSRWPIVSAGSWDDTFVNDRGFAWAQIDLPGTNDLYVVSVHLYGSGSASDRGAEAAAIKARIQSEFPAGAWVIVGGDMNTSSRTEAAINTFKTFLSDNPVPTDAVVAGDDDTNEPRNNPYDYVLPSFALTNYLTPVALPSQSFPKGLVFDSNVYTPLSDVAPVQFADSHVSGMQHMAVVKDFLIPLDGTTDTNAPAITTQPQNIAVPPGSNATFTIVASGAAPLHYQWRFFGTNLNGATETTFTRTNAQSADAGGYSVVVTNDHGSVTSQIATLTINIPQTDALTTLAGWDVSALSNFGPSPLSPTTNAENLTIVGLTRGAGVTTVASAALRAWGGNGFDAISAGGAVAAGDFASFSISANADHTVSFTSISKFDYRRSSGGPPNGVLQYQIGNGGFTDIATLAYTNSNSSGSSLAAIDLSTIGALQNVAASNTVTFRIVNYGASSSGGTWYVYDVANSSAPDFVVQGIVSANTTNPPAIAPTLSTANFSDGQFSFLISGTAGSNYIVQVSTNIATTNWISLSTNSAPFSFTETNASGFPQRFYRGVVAP